MRSAGFSFNGEHGFSLIEAVISIGLLTVASLGVAQLFAMSGTATQRARSQTSTSVLAIQKMEQLRSLTWGFDPSGTGLPVSDTSTDLAVDPPASTGTGLQPAPGGTLDRNTSGFVDYLDKFGTWIGTGETPPGGTVFIRRWSIDPLPTNPNDTLVFQVYVTTLKSAIAAAKSGTTPAAGVGRGLEDARVVSVKTRKAL